MAQIVKDTVGMLSASQVCSKLNVSVKTLTNWYKWQADDSFEKPKNMPMLPEYYRTHNNGPRFWKKESVKELKAFQEFIPRGRSGIMGEFNQQYWSPKSKKEVTNNE